MIHKLYKKNKEIILYLLCGGLTTAVNFMAFWIFTEIVSASAGKASAWAWGISVLFAYLVNKIYVFESEKNSLAELLREAGAFIGARVFSGIFEVGMMAFLADFMRIPLWRAKIFVSGAVILLNFAASKWIIFRRQEEKGGGECEKAAVP